MKRFMKWKLCDNCYSKVNVSRRENIKAKRNKRREREKKKGEFTLDFDLAYEFQAIMEAISSLTDEVRFKITPQGLFIKSSDVSRIVLYSLDLPKESFTGYSYNCEGLTFEVNIDDFYKILSKINPESPLQIHRKQLDGFISINSGNDHFELANLDIDVEDIPMNNLLKIEYPSRFSVDPRILLDKIQKAEIYSELLCFKVEETKITIHSEGQIGEYSGVIELEDLEACDMKIPEEFKEGFYEVCITNSFIKSLIEKLLPITESLTIHLKHDIPIRGDLLLKNSAQIIFFQAPRVKEIDDEEDEW